MPAFSSSGTGAREPELAKIDLIDIKRRGVIRMSYACYYSITPPAPWPARVRSETRTKP